MPPTKFLTPDKYTYHHGLGSYHESEAIDGALPVAMNQPQKPPFGLYAEKLSGTAFTAPRGENLQTWVYRVLPSAAHAKYTPIQRVSKTSLDQKVHHIPDQIRWDPFDLDVTSDWTDSLRLISHAGDPNLKQGLGIMVYAAGKSMAAHESFSSVDGDFLIVPQHGVLDIQTELGYLLVRPGEFTVIPRGFKYRVSLPRGPSRGYILELYEGHFQLPDLGTMGSQGLANERDFQITTAAYDFDTSTEWTCVVKLNGEYFSSTQSHTPFDVVAWHGSFYPYKYDLGRFNTIFSVSYDHTDPSIFTVLSAPSYRKGTAIADLVIFPPRWLVMEDTFRPPQYHRNVMSEFMGLIQGDYHGKKGGFKPAGASLHNVMSAHGPDAQTHEMASNAELVPVKVGAGSLAFMFETCFHLGVTDWALKECQKVQDDYNEHTWQPLVSHFTPPETATVGTNGKR